MERVCRISDMDIDTPWEAQLKGQECGTLNWLFRKQTLKRILGQGRKNLADTL